MRWLLTIGKDVDVQELRTELERLGSTVDPAPSVPLDADEQVVRAEGPDDLPARLTRAGLGAVKAYPDSELELYGTGSEAESES
jgi:hypothetical protein